MFDKMKQLMEMKQQADKIKKELDATLVECTDVAGIKLVINGSQEIQSIAIEDRLVSIENKKHLERDVMRSVNAAIRKAQMTAAKKMQNLLPGGFPGM